MRGWKGAALAAGFAALAAGSAGAQQIACGQPHVIAPGDTLHRIAVRAYGEQGNFRTVYEANRARLGWRNPSQIEIGQIVAIPCPDGTAPARIAIATAPRAPGSAEPDAAAAIAVAALGGAEAATVAVLAPDAAHLDALGPDLFRLSLPWARPDCDAPSDALAVRLCAEVLWSQPLRARYEATAARAGETPGPDAPICRAAEAAQARPCLEALLGGEVDLAVVEAGLFDALADEPAFAGRVAELPERFRETTLHAVAPATSPGAAADIARLDAGLAALEASGEALALRLEALAPQAR